MFDNHEIASKLDGFLYARTGESTKDLGHVLRWFNHYDSFESVGADVAITIERQIALDKLLIDMVPSSFLYDYGGP